jgi:hypothetical protein
VGVTIDPWTATPSRAGERLDPGWAVSVLATWTYGPAPWDNAIQDHARKGP